VALASKPTGKPESKETILILSFAAVATAEVVDDVLILKPVLQRQVIKARLKELLAAALLLNVVLKVSE